jgi:hypothetical protein
MWMEEIIICSLGLSSPFFFPLLLFFLKYIGDETARRN